MVEQEGRYSLGKKQQRPNAPFAPYPKERLLARTRARLTGCLFLHEERFVSFRVSHRFVFRVGPQGGGQSNVGVSSVPSMATPTLFVIRGVIDIWVTATRRMIRGER